MLSYNIVTLTTLALLIFPFLILFFKVDRFSPIFLMLLFALYDVYLPFLIFINTGLLGSAPYEAAMSVEDYFNGMILYTGYYFVLIVFYIFFTCRIKPGFISHDTAARVSIAPKGFVDKVFILTFVFLTLSLAKFYFHIREFGSLNDYIYQSLVFTGARVGGGHRAAGFFELLRVDVIFTSLMGLSFFLRNHYQSGSRFYFAKYLFPGFAILFALAYMLRGKLLIVLYTLAFAEYLRLRFYSSPTGLKRFYTNIGVCLFAILFVFGPVRDGLRLASVNDERPYSFIPAFIYQGSGLRSVSQIYSMYGSDLPFFQGKSYIDMLLLPVPRALYTSKPTWYGIDDITRAMGWPKTSMSAVTMPGEAFSNFGYFGILTSLFWAFLFAFLYYIARANLALYIMTTPILSFSMAMTSSWMSFTGFVNGLISFFGVVLIYLFMKLRYTKR